jgi:hypothetical protein
LWRKNTAVKGNEFMLVQGEVHGKIQEFKFVENVNNQVALKTGSLRNSTIFCLET